MATIADFDNLAAQQVGVPYVFGGTSLRGSPHPGLDCSGFPYAVSLTLGETIPRSSELQFAGLTKIVAPQRRGDLVFYDVPGDTQDPPNHMAIWWDAQTVLEAPRTGELVKFAPPLPYKIMGYRSLPFPNAAPVPIPPLPVPIREETMSLATLPNGEVVISAVGAGTRADHLLVFTLNPTNPNTPQFNVIDVTAGIGTSNPYTVQSA